MNYKYERKFSREFDSSSNSDDNETVLKVQRATQTDEILDDHELHVNINENSTSITRRGTEECLSILKQNVS